MQQTEMTITDHAKLVKLSAEIRDSYETAQALATQARSKANEAITEALLLGKKLIEAKALVKHGEWEKWIEENCGFTDVTARRYMRLAKGSHVIVLDDAETIRQAYLLTGIIPEPEKKPTVPTTPDQSTATDNQNNTTEQPKNPGQPDMPETSQLTEQMGSVQMPPEPDSGAQKATTEESSAVQQVTHDEKQEPTSNGLSPLIDNVRRAWVALEDERKPWTEADRKQFESLIAYIQDSPLYRQAFTA